MRGHNGTILARLLFLAPVAFLCLVSNSTAAPNLEIAVQAACKQSRIAASAPIETSEVFIDGTYLNYLAGTHNDKGHVLHPDLDRVVRYTLEKGLNALETNLVFSATRELSQSPIVRISVKPAQTPACKAYRYPWWQMPKLRRLGLGPDHCVAVEMTDRPTASVRVLSQATKVFRISDEREWFALWRLDVQAGTVGANGQEAPAIEITDFVARSEGGGKGYQGWAWGCPDWDTRARALDRLIVGKGNPLLRRPEMVVVPDPKELIAETAMSDAALSELRWIELEECASGGNNFNAIGTVWIEDIPVREELRRALHVLRGDRLLVAPMPPQFRRAVYSNDGLLHYRNGFAVNLTRSFKDDEWRRLVVFDENLIHVATWTLTDQQMKSLVPPDPAKVNRCYGSDHRQFQRRVVQPADSRP